MGSVNASDILIPFVGGLGLFIYGMQVMAQGLQNAAGTKMKKMLEAITNNRFLGVMLGALVTAIIQSSSATTVMVVGFVNAGLMNLAQAMGIIMGANIGTTATGWLVSSVEWAKFLSPSVIAPVVIMLGVILLMVSKKSKNKEVASIIIGFGILFVGIKMMSDSVAPLKDSEYFRSIFVMLGGNPFLGILAGTLVTGVLQSSSASVGILQTLAASGLVPFNAAVYIIMGQNIGTCITALLSSVGASKTAKSAAYMHLLFNIIGTAIFSLISVGYFHFMRPSWGYLPISQTEISSVHTAFNILTTILLFPAANMIISMAKKISGLQDSDMVDEGKLVHLDDRVLETPSLAVQSAMKEVVRMGHIVERNLDLASEAIFDKNEEKIQKVYRKEKVIDKLSNAITQYIVKICNMPISMEENTLVTSLLHVITDMERVGDHCENLVELGKLMEQENTAFSEKATLELKELIETSKSSYRNSLRALEFLDADAAKQVIADEEKVNEMESELRVKHIHRLASQKCAAASGVVFLDTLTNMERISDHALNIAQVVVGKRKGSITPLIKDGMAEQ